MSAYVLTDTNRGAAAAVARAVAARLEVDRANEPTRRSNAAILRSNNRLRRLLESETLTDERRAELRQHIRDTSPLPHRLNDHAVSILKFVAERRATLAAQTPDVWRAQIAMIPIPLRHHVACVVWWDYFSSRVGKNAWHHLDDWLLEPVTPVDSDQLAAALWAVGYLAYDAIERVRGVDVADEEHQDAA